MAPTNSAEALNQQADSQDFNLDVFGIKEACGGMRARFLLLVVKQVSHESGIVGCNRRSFALGGHASFPVSWPDRGI